MKKFNMYILAFAMIVTPLLATAKNSVNTVAVQGYDLVSYHQGEGVPIKGHGNNVVYHEGVAYLFSSEENKNTFKNDPAKYLPAYGGFCAFGVTKGKKFEGDPMAYKVVDGKVYLNLNKDVQKIWLKDVSGNIKSASEQWAEIKDKHASEL